MIEIKNELDYAVLYQLCFQGSECFSNSSITFQKGLACHFGYILIISHNLVACLWCNFISGDKSSYYHYALIYHNSSVNFAFYSYIYSQYVTSQSCCLTSTESINNCLSCLSAICIEDSSPTWDNPSTPNNTQATNICGPVMEIISY